MLIGLPRSGKSTKAKAWLNYECNIRDGECIWGEGRLREPRPRVIVNADQIRLTLHGKRFWVEKEVEVWQLENFMLRYFFNAGYDVLADETHTSNASIMGVLRVDLHADYCLVDTPIEECKRRALACGHDDLVTRDVIDRMEAQWSAWKHDPKTHIDKLRLEVRKENERR